jgi:hypothetical protein
MCRLYAFRSNEPTKVECSLVYAQNALLTQSISDLRGEAHPHGWGISWYEDGLPSVEKKDTAAHQDESFNLMAERVYAKSVIAHVRQATVGEHSLLNTHPFIFGPWTFVHNGTLGGFDQLEEILIEETDTDLDLLLADVPSAQDQWKWRYSGTGPQTAARGPGGVNPSARRPRPGNAIEAHYPSEFPADQRPHTGCDAPAELAFPAGPFGHP